MVATVAQQAPSAPDHYAALQAGLAAELTQRLAKAFALLDPADVAGTVDKFRTAVEAIVQQFGRMAVSAAWQHYRRARVAAGITGKPAAPPNPQPVPRDMVSAMVDDVVKRADPVEALDTLDAEAERLVLDRGRQAMMDAAAQDAEARGWARVPDPGACWFCIMLATRGAVYRSRSTADFQPHPNCRCAVQPVFNRYEPSARVREYQSLYERLKKEYGGGRDLMVAFRQAIEGRPVTGPLTKPYTRAK